MCVKNLNKLVKSKGEKRKLVGYFKLVEFEIIK
jgi:hypothetical protein